MSYWEITPHRNKDFTSCVMAAETDDDAKEAFDYAVLVLEDQWDRMEEDGFAMVTIALHSGEMPEVEDDS